MGLKPLSNDERISFSLGAVALIIFTGITAGLQVALFSIDRMFLRVLRTTGSPRVQQQAKSLLRVLGLGHWTLVALLTFNALAMAGLPIILGVLFDELTALLVSITAVLFISDIIPLAVFVRWAVPICSFFIPFIWTAAIITAPVSYPVGKLLDFILGHGEELLQRDELAALLVAPNDQQPFLRDSEVSMVKGALRLSSHRVRDYIKTSCDEVYMLSSLTLLDQRTVEEILLKGYSRVPVYLNNNRRHILGALFVRSLVNLCFTNPENPPRAGEYPLSEVIRLPVNTTLYNSYLAFQENTSNMAVVYDERGVMKGIWTLTDLLSTLYSTELIDGENNQRQEIIVELLERMKALSTTKRKIQHSGNNLEESGNL